jgi:thymidylate kinase
LVAQDFRLAGRGAVATIWINHLDAGGESDRVMRSVLLCIVGIDGSGKSTLAKEVVGRMQSRGIRSRYVWGGFDPTVFLRPAIWLARCLIYREDRHSRVSESKGRVLKNRTWSTVYYYVVLADYALQMLIRVKLPLLLGQSVICDRYVHDMVVTTAVVLDYSGERLLRLLARMQRLVPRSDRVLVADLAEQIAYERKDDVPSIVFLRKRRRDYQRIAQAHGLSVLDASQPLDTLVEIVDTQVLQVCAMRE